MFAGKTQKLSRKSRQELNKTGLFFAGERERERETNLESYGVRGKLETRL